MPLSGKYEPSQNDRTREQVELYEATNGVEGGTLKGKPVIVLTFKGVKSGKIRKFALMRVEHDGEYALVASKGGAPDHPQWYRNLVANPSPVMIQDGPQPFDAAVREVDGDERAAWWDRAVAAFPSYAEYQTRTERRIPVLVAKPIG